MNQEQAGFPAAWNGMDLKQCASVPEYLEYWEYLLEYRSTLGVAAPDVSFSGYFILRECILESNSELIYGQIIANTDCSVWTTKFEAVWVAR